MEEERNCWVKTRKSLNWPWWKLISLRGVANSVEWGISQCIKLRKYWRERQSKSKNKWNSYWRAWVWSEWRKRYVRLDIAKLRVNRWFSNDSRIA